MVSIKGTLKSKTSISDKVLKRYAEKTVLYGHISMWANFLLVEYEAIPAKYSMVPESQIFSMNLD